MCLIVVFACWSRQHDGLRCTDGAVFFFQAEDGIRDLVRSRGLGDVYKRQLLAFPMYFLRSFAYAGISVVAVTALASLLILPAAVSYTHLTLPTSDLV